MCNPKFGRGNCRFLSNPIAFHSFNGTSLLTLSQGKVFGLCVSAITAAGICLFTLMWIASITTTPISILQRGSKKISKLLFFVVSNFLYYLSKALQRNQSFQVHVCVPLKHSANYHDKKVTLAVKPVNSHHSR